MRLEWILADSIAEADEKHSQFPLCFAHAGGRDRVVHDSG